MFPKLKFFTKAILIQNTGNSLQRTIRECKGYKSRTWDWLKRMSCQTPDFQRPITIEEQIA